MESMKDYTRITSLLSHLYNFSFVDATVLENKKQIGINTHKAIEEYLKNKKETVQETDSHYCYYTAFKNYYEDEKLGEVEILHVEKRFFLEDYKLTGMVDLIFKNKKNEIVLLDWKTSRSINTLAVSLQMLFYKMLAEHHGIKIDKCVVLQLKTTKRNKQYTFACFDKEVQEEAHAILNKHLLSV